MVNVAPNATHTVKLRFKPTGLGQRTGTLTFTSNTPGSPHSVALVGVATDGSVVPGSPSLAYSPNALAFGEVQVGENGQLFVEVTNTGDVSATISSATISGTGFSITSSELLPADPDPEPGGINWLTVDGALIKDSVTDEPYRFKAVNWYGASAGGLAPDGLWGRSYKAIMDKIKDLGANAIRYLVCQDITWAGRKPSPNTYIDFTLNPDLFSEGTMAQNAWPNRVLTGLEILDRIVAYAKEIGLRIILDMHCAAPNVSNDQGLHYKWYTTATPTAPGATTGADGEPRNEEQMLAAWEFFADHYKNEPVVCGFDLINEPMETTWDEDPNTGIYGFYNRCVARIRTKNTKALIICEGILQETITMDNGLFVGAQASGGLQGVREKPVIDPQGLVVYSPHEYGSYFPGYVNSADQNVYRNYMSHADYDVDPYAVMDEVWSKFWGWMVKENKHPIFIGEIGSWYKEGKANYSGVAVPYTATNKAKDTAWFEAWDEWSRTWFQGFSFWAINPGGEPDGLLQPQTAPAPGSPVPGDGNWVMTVYPEKVPVVNMLYAADAFSEPDWVE